MRFSIRIATIGMLLLPNVADDVRGEVKVMVPGCVMVGAFTVRVARIRARRLAGPARDLKPRLEHLRRRTARRRDVDARCARTGECRSWRAEYLLGWCQAADVSK